MKENADGVGIQQQIYTTEVYFFVWNCELQQGVCKCQENDGPLS